MIAGDRGRLPWFEYDLAAIGKRMVHSPSMT
jgi:hypothetical protein